MLEWREQQVKQETYALRTIKIAHKSLYTSLLACGLAIVGLYSSAYAFSGPGSGTSGRPYLIGSCSRLQAVANNLSATYKLIRNIDCTGVTFTSIGDSSTPFTGILNGGGYSVNNLTINQSSSDNVGLFGETNGATITNMAISEAVINGNNQVGTLAGNTINSTFSDIRVHNTNITASGNNVGGLIGELSGSGLSTSYATSAFVTGGSTVGGLVGWAIGGTSVNDSFAQASITATGSVVGGLIGQIGSGPTTVENTYATGLMQVSGTNTGSLVGIVTSGASVSNSFTVLAGSSTTDPATTGAAFGVQSGSLSNVWFDPTDTGYNNCVGTGDSSGCSGSSSDSQFKGNSSNAPMSSWDFTNNWITQSTGYPNLTPLFNWGPTDSPNNNDANGDGIDDSFQSNVNSVPSDTNVWSTVVVPGSSGCDVEDPGWANPIAQDTGYSRQLQTMTGFTLDCAQTGATVPVTIIYDKQYNTAGWILRYYNSSNQTYSTIPNAVFGTKTIGGVVITTVTYSVTDGGAFDSDGTANGVIVDPVAPAVSALAIAAPATGYGAPAGDSTLVTYLAIGAAILTVAGTALLYKQKRLTRKK